MAPDFSFEPLIQAIVDGKSDDAIELVEAALKNDVSAYEILDLGLIKGMKIVSDKYDRKEYFVSDLASSAEAVTESLEKLKPHLEAADGSSKGVIVIGVVKECSQEIGKNIVAAMLSGGGFRVYDLGINVSPYKFVDNAKEVGANIIAMGSPMLQTIKYFGETEQLLREEGLRDRVKVLVGGASTKASTPERVGADAWAADGRAAVEAALKLMKRLKEEN